MDRALVQQITGPQRILSKPPKGMDCAFRNSRQSHSGLKNLTSTVHCFDFPGMVLPSDHCFSFRVWFCPRVIVFPWGIDLPSGHRFSFGVWFCPQVIAFPLEYGFALGSSFFWGSSICPPGGVLPSGHGSAFESLLCLRGVASC